MQKNDCFIHGRPLLSKWMYIYWWLFFCRKPVCRLCSMAFFKVLSHDASSAAIQNLLYGFLWCGPYKKWGAKL